MIQLQDIHPLTPAKAGLGTFHPNNTDYALIPAFAGMSGDYHD